MMIKVGDTIEIIQEDREHPFQLGDKLVVTELCDEGCVWAKREDKLLGCLIPSEFVKIEKKQKKKTTKKKGAKK